MTQLTDPPDTLLVWDKPNTLKRLMNKEALLAQLANIYLAENSQRMATFDSAIQSGIPAEINKIAHTIKGIAANLGLNRLQYYTNELEQAAKNEITNSTQL